MTKLIKVGILGGDIPQHVFYSDVIPRIVERMKNPSVRFYFTDQPGCATMAAKYFAAARYRSCTLVCVDPPRHNLGNFKLQLFSTMSEAVAYLKTNMDELIEV